MNYDLKQATVRFAPDKVGVERILKQYDATPFSVTLEGAITTVQRDEGLTIRTWFERLPPGEPPADVQERLELRLELIRDDAGPVPALREVQLDESSARHLKLHGELQEVALPDQPRRRRFVRSAELAAEAESPETSLRVVLIATAAGDEPGRPWRLSAVLAVPRTGQLGARAATGAVALVSGGWQVTPAHLCTQPGCVEHFHKSLENIPGLAAVRPLPELESPRAEFYWHVRQAIDVWGLRETLRQRGVELAHIVPPLTPSAPSSLRIELPRWLHDEGSDDAQQCLVCRERLADQLRTWTWAQEVEIAGGGVQAQLPTSESVDLAVVLDALEATGICPNAVWWIPEGAAMPKAAPPQLAARGSVAKSGGSAVHPVVEFEFQHLCDLGPDPLAPFAEQQWLSRSQVTAEASGSRIQASIDDRQFANLSPLLAQFRQAGHSPTQIRLSEFGEIRIQLAFAHICGEVEYSKPPKPKPKEEKADADQKPEPEQPPAKPFVPQPLRPAESSLGRQAIEAAVDRVPWVQQAVYHQYHTRREFNGPTKLMLSLTPAASDLIRLDELTTSLRQAGFPPTSVTVSRLFPSIPFGKPLPHDLLVTDHEGQPQALASFRQPHQLLAVMFVNVHCKPWDKYEYTADPKYFQHLKTTLEKHQGQVSFVAVSANSNDTPADVTQLLEQAGLHVPVLHDGAGAARAVFNAQVVTPPPHVFLFDATGRLRYAGEPHDNWNKPEQPPRDYLDEAIQLVTAGKYQENGAVFFSSPKCNCSDPKCKCPKCGCGASCRCSIGH